MEIIPVDHDYENWQEINTYTTKRKCHYNVKHTQQKNLQIDISSSYHTK